MANTAGKWILLFPGQGSQSTGMGREAAENFGEMRRTFEEASDALGYSMERLCFEDPEAQLNLTEFTQPAILTVSVGVARVLAARTGLVQAAHRVAGHSLGEYSALVTSGALDLGDALRAVRFRGQAMQRAVPVGAGAMAAYVGAQTARVVEICANETKREAVVEVVNFNSRTQLVLSGHAASVERVATIIAGEKLGRVLPLPVSAPFHSSLMRPAAEEMARYLEDVRMAALRTPIVANVDAKAYEGTAYGKAMLVAQIASAVLWTQTLDGIRSELGAPDRTARTWIECGPGNVLQGLVRKTLEGETTAGTSDLDTLEALLEKAGA